MPLDPPEFILKVQGKCDGVTGFLAGNEELNTLGYERVIRKFRAVFRLRTITRELY